MRKGRGYPSPVSPLSGLHSSPNLGAERPSLEPHRSPPRRGTGAEGMEPEERIESGTTLGKRHRSRVLPRTASMVTVPSAAKQGRQEGVADVPSSYSLPTGSVALGMGSGGGGGAPPRGLFCGGYFAPAAFLKACGLCNRSLGPGHDIYIYRGEVAFCSQECREQRIEYDERMEQTCSLTSVSGASGSDQSGSGGETVAAA